MIYIIIPVFNRLAFTTGCIDSLMGQDVQNFTIIVVNDGSTDRTAAHLRQFYPAVKVLSGDGSLWWTGATNAGVREALALSRLAKRSPSGDRHPSDEGDLSNKGSSSVDYILTLNNDLVVGRDYLRCLLAVARKHPKSLVGSVSLDIDRPNHIHFAGTKWNPRTAKYSPAWHIGTSYPELKKGPDLLPTDILPGRGVFVPIAAYEELGLYDKKAFPHYMADEDFSLRAKKAGYRLLISTGAVVYNHVSATGLQQPAKGWNYYKSVFTSIRSPANARNRWNWARKHAAVPAAVYFTFDMARIVKSLFFKS